MIRATSAKKFAAFWVRLGFNEKNRRDFAPTWRNSAKATFARSAFAPAEAQSEICWPTASRDEPFPWTTGRSTSTRAEAGSNTFAPLGYPTAPRGWANGQRRHPEA